MPRPTREVAQLRERFREMEDIAIDRLMQIDEHARNIASLQIALKQSEQFRKETERELEIERRVSGFLRQQLASEIRR